MGNQGTFSVRSLIPDALRRWGMPSTLPARDLGSRDNNVYGFEHAGREWVLRLTSPQHRDAEQIETELVFVRYLAEGGAPVCAPLPSVEGRLVEPVVRDRSHTYYASIFESAPGRRGRLGEGTWVRTLGRAIGCIHRLSKDFRPLMLNVDMRFDWQNDPTLRDASMTLPMEARPLLQSYSQVVGELRGLERGRDAYGMVHSDVDASSVHVDHAGAVKIYDLRRLLLSLVHLRHRTGALGLSLC